MADTFDFWTHGVTVVPQHTALSNDGNRGLFIMPLSWGTVVRQDHDTDNWFHIPLPSATQLDDWPAYHAHAWLRVKIADHAEIDKINVYSTSHPSLAFKESPINKKTSFQLRGREDQVSLDLHDLKNRGPLVISVHVQFDGDGPADEREVLFAGAGVSWEEKR